MKLISLSLSNFRQHKETHINFSNGITGVIGANGAGKTTLVEAIAFSLFGSKAVRGKLDDLPRRGSKKTSLKVEMAFEHGGQAIRLERSTSNAKIFLGGSPEAIAVGTREVSDKIVSLIGMDYEEFVSTFFTEQKGLEFLSHKTGAAERERFVAEMMGFNKIEKLQQILRTERRDLKNESEGFESSLSSKDTLEKNLTNEKKALHALKREEDSYQRAVLEVEKKEQEERKAFSDLESTQLEWNRINSEARTLEREIALRKEETKELDDRIIADNQKLSELPNLKIDTLSSELDDLIFQNNKLIKQRSERIADLRAEESRITTLIQSANTELRSLVDTRKRLSSLDREAKCPTCHQALESGFEEASKHYDIEISGIEERLNELRKESKSFSTSDAQTKEYDATIESCEKLIVEKRQLLAQISKAESLKSQIDEKAERKAKLLEQLELLVGKKKSYETSLDALHFSEQEFTKRKTAAQAADKILNIARVKFVEAKGKREGKELLIARIENELSELETKRQHVESMRRRLLVLEDGDRVLGEFRKQLNREIRPKIAELASDYISELTDGRYSEVELGEDFSPTVIDDGEAKPVISGGEVDILNLCVRLALSNLIAERAGHPFSLLVLDEVFGALDENRRSNVLLLLERLRTRFDQIILITHFDDIKESVDSVVEIRFDEEAGITASIENTL